MKYASTIGIALSLVVGVGCTDDGTAEDVGDETGTDTETETDDDVGPTDTDADTETADTETAETETADTETADTETADTETADSADTDTDTDSADTDTAETDTTGGLDENTIYEIQDGTVDEGTAVDVDGVWVTGVTTNAFFAQELEGGQFSGVYVFVGNDGPDIAALEIGDMVDITGMTTEFSDLTEIDASLGTVEVVGAADPIPHPDLVTATDLNPENGEPWEGVFVRIEGDVLDVVELPGFDEFVVDDGGATSVIDNFLYSVIVDGTVEFPSFSAGASFTAIQGPLNFTFDQFKVAPRSAADLEGYIEFENPVLGIADLSPGDLVITEIMYDPNLCNDTNCEWIEIFNPTMNEIDLVGLRVQDELLNGQGQVMESLIIAPGGFVQLGKGPADLWGYTNDADAYTGTNPGFNNSGDDQAVILNDLEIIDMTAKYNGQGSSDNGVSWKLDPSQFDAVANDVAGNWCYSTVDFGDGDLGSPGAVNEEACNADLP